jgi:light-regulated signal transduction histidine kinase (bacteriophytochrome)
MTGPDSSIREHPFADSFEALLSPDAGVRNSAIELFKKSPPPEIIPSLCAEILRLHEETQKLRSVIELQMNSVLEAERRLIKLTDELQAVNWEIEAFSYSIGHDLRAPLRHMEGFIEILRATKAQLLDDEGHKYLQYVLDWAREMGRLIDGLLGFSRLARLEMGKSRVDLNEITQSVLREIEPGVAGRAIEWSLERLPLVNGDPAMLRRGLLELINNAVKFTRKRKLALIEIGSTSNDSEIIIFVRDNGVGFDSGYAQKLFGIFQRLHRASEYEGAGIGLASVRRIVSRHGGRTWAESEPDVGATFYFSLPSPKNS